MAAPQTTQNDLLPHIKYQQEPAQGASPQSMAAAAPPAQSLAARASSTDGSITIISAFGCSVVLNYSLSTSEIDVSLVLKTPVGSVTLGHASLNPQNPSITLGGSIGSFKAEATVSLDFSTLVLTAKGTVCAPFVGCKSGQVQIHL